MDSVDGGVRDLQLKLVDSMKFHKYSKFMVYSPTATDPSDKRTVSYASLRTRHGPLIGGC